MAKKQSQIVDLVETFQTVTYTPRNSEKKCIFGPLEVSEKKIIKNRKKKVFEKNQAKRNGFYESPGREMLGLEI